MDTFIHRPTRVEAIKVEKPWVAVQKACPFAHPIKKGSGTVDFYIVSNPGKAETFRAYPGDWIVHYPTGCWAVQTDEQFTKYYSEFLTESLEGQVGALADYLRSAVDGDLDTAITLLKEALDDDSNSDPQPN